jgi:hypothetical protein
MLTICGVPKPFRGHFDVIQRNAIESWTRLVPKCEVILLGNEEGTARVAADLGVRHLSEIECNEFGTPLLDSAFHEAEKEATHPVLCYVNADIILMSDFLPAVQEARSKFDRFLLIGRRWDLDLTERLTFENGWEGKVRSDVRARGKIRPHAAIDYFVFPKRLWTRILPFAIGRTAWDNWLIYQALKEGVPVIDLTECVQVVHQNHSYFTPDGLLGVEKGPEGQRNLALAGGYSRAYTIWDAKYKLTRNGIKRRRSVYFFYRQLVNLTEKHPAMLPVLKAVRVVISQARRLQV